MLSFFKKYLPLIGLISSSLSVLISIFLKSTAASFSELVNSQNKRKTATEPVSELTTNRLSVYLRCLNQLEAAGADTISSQALAEQFHLNAAQIRKDLAYFGEFGVRGVGYEVKELRRHLRQILGLDRKLKVAVMGAGNLGLALADYPGFKREGFEIVAMFDVAEATRQADTRPGLALLAAAMALVHLAAAVLATLLLGVLVTRPPRNSVVGV